MSQTTNQDRLESLRGRLKILFGKLAGYLDQAEKSQNDLPKVMAAETRDYYRYHLDLFHSHPDLQTMNAEFIDAILAEWMQSRALIHDPSLVHETSRAVAADVAKLLKRAEDVLAEFDDNDLNSLSPETREHLQKMAPGDEIVVARLMLIQDLLRECVVQDRDKGIKPFPA